MSYKYTISKSLVSPLDWIADIHILNESSDLHKKYIDSLDLSSYHDFSEAHLPSSQI